MLTPRERFLECMHFGSPDRVPFEPGWPRESTLAAWREQGLPAEQDWQEVLLETLGLPELKRKARAGPGGGAAPAAGL